MTFTPEAERSSRSKERVLECEFDVDLNQAMGIQCIQSIGEAARKTGIEVVLWKILLTRKRADCPLHPAERASPIQNWERINLRPKPRVLPVECLSEAHSIPSNTVNDSSTSPTAPDSTSTQNRTMICLHVGCGPPSVGLVHEAFSGKDWKEIRLDLDPAVQPDVVASIADLSPVQTESVDSVWSSHNLEHLPAHDVSKALAGFHRVLRPGGLLLMTMPDLQAVAQLIVDDQLEGVAFQSPAGPISPIDILYGHRPSLAAGKSMMAHRTGFTQTTLRAHLQRAGFSEGKVWTQGFDLWALMTR